MKIYRVIGRHEETVEFFNLKEALQYAEDLTDYDFCPLLEVESEDGSIYRNIIISDCNIKKEIKMETLKKGLRSKIKPPEVLIADIPGKGRGVIANKNFKKRDIVEQSPVIFIKDVEYDMIVSTSLSQYSFQVGPTDHAAIALGYASLYNHSYNSNCEFVLSDKVIIITADRNIKKGEELTLDYGWDKDFAKKHKIKD